MSFETLDFYRGVSSTHPIDRISLITPRVNRRPRNSAFNSHLLADNWFKSKFGTSYRSAGAFVTPQLSIARGYAASDNHIVRVIPITTYTFCWSPKISDMLMLCMPPCDDHTFIARLEHSLYSEGNLELAHKSGNELMLACTQYLSIPINLLEIHETPATFSPIILLN